MISYKEKLMPVLLTEKHERKKSISKIGISALSKTKKIRKTIKDNPELARNNTKNNSRNKNENIGNVDKKRINQNESVFQHIFSLFNFYNPYKKQKSPISEKLFPKKSISLDILNNYSEYQKCYTNRNKKGSISTKNSFKYNNNYNTIHNLKQEKTQKK